MASGARKAERDSGGLMDKIKAVLTGGPEKAPMGSGAASKARDTVVDQKKKLDSQIDQYTQ